MLIHFKLDYQGAWPPLVYTIVTSLKAMTVIYNNHSLIKNKHLNRQMKSESKKKYKQKFVKKTKKQKDNDSR